MSISSARDLLERAEGRDRLERHLLVAAALREALGREPVVVGGTAEEFWTAAEYHETDLDLCLALTAEDEAILEDLGLVREGRHHYHDGAAVAVEFPAAEADGDPDRFHREGVEVGGVAVIIGLDDLYLDRLRQATVRESHEGTEFHSALAVVAARYEDIDWEYVRARIGATVRREGSVGRLMKTHDRAIRRRVRDTLGT